jgi:hypothetical protein
LDATGFRLPLCAEWELAVRCRKEPLIDLVGFVVKGSIVLVDDDLLGGIDEEIDSLMPGKSKSFDCLIGFGNNRIVTTMVYPGFSPME